MTRPSSRIMIYVSSFFRSLFPLEPSQVVAEKRMTEKMRSTLVICRAKNSQHIVFAEAISSNTECSNVMPQLTIDNCRRVRAFLLKDVIQGCFLAKSC